MKNITILLPIHEITDDYKVMFENAVSSVDNFHENVKLFIISPPTMKDTLIELLSDTKVDYKIIENNTGDTTFVKQINLGIDNVDTEWFSILEVDDSYHNSWLKTVSDYVKFNEDVDIFLPLVKDINVEGEFLNFTNESVWAYGFSDEQGFLDNDVLMEYQNYQTSGGLYRTKTVIENGKFKDNFKLTFSYEFLLRLTHKNVKIMVIPKIGYIHVNFREGSLFWNYKNSENDKLSENEVKFWVDTAKKEHFFVNKRDIEYKMD
jgi:hypothetical protein